MIYLITAIAAITTYIGIITVKYGIQKSISFSDEIAEKPFKWFFEGAMFISGVMLFIYAYNNDMLFLKIGSIFIFMIGLFPLGETPKWVKIPHIITAVLGFGFCLLLLYFDLDQIYPLLIIIALSTIAAFVFKNRIWAVEMTIIYGTFITLLINNLK